MLNVEFCKMKYSDSMLRTGDVLLKQDEDQKEVLESVYKISEELQKCPIRREKEQKDSFRKVIGKQLKETPWQLEKDETEYTKYKNIKKCAVNNIYSTESLDYKVILMAHYDTPGNSLLLPPAMRLIGVGYNFYFAFSISLIALAYISDYLNSMWITYYVLMFIFILICIIVIREYKTSNTHNANDNTSGVITVLAITKYISKYAPELAPKIKLVFTDKEEKGLLGAKVFRKKLGASVDNRLILNFDCVGNGSHLNLQYDTEQIKNDVIKSLHRHLELVVNSNKIVTRYLAASDYNEFKNMARLGFIFVEPSIFPFGYYLPNIHTNKDTYINDEYLAKFSLQISKFIVEYLEKSSEDRGIVKHG